MTQQSIKPSPSELGALCDYPSCDTHEASPGLPLPVEHHQPPAQLCSREYKESPPVACYSSWAARGKMRERKVYSVWAGQEKAEGGTQ